MIIQIDFQILCNKIPKAMGIIISFIIPFYVMFIFNIVKDNINYVKVILDFLKQINFHEKFFPLLFFLNWLLLKVILFSFWTIHLDLDRWFSRLFLPERRRKTPMVVLRSLLPRE